jgi:tetratricopeptide (TPR) repeat protein
VKICVKLLAFILLVRPAPGFGQQDRAAKLDSFLAAAQQAQARNDYATAEGAYKAAVNLRADMPELWANLGLMQNALGHYPDAIDSFRRATQLNPALYVPNLFLGIDYTHINRAREAIPFLVKAVRINPRDPQAPLSLGQAYLALKDFGAARGAFQQAVALDAKNSSAWFDLGVVALDEVEADGWKLSTENANSVWAKALFAESLQEQLRFKEAVSQEQAVIALDPRFPCAHSRLGFLYVAQQQDADALREFTAESQGCALAALGRARLNIDAGGNAEALMALRTLWNLDPGFVRSHVPFLTNGLGSERSAAFSMFLDGQNGAGAVGSDLYALLSPALRGALLPVDPFAFSTREKSAQIHGRSSAAETDAKEARYGRCAADLADGIAGESNHDLLLLARCAFMTGDYNLSAAASELVASRPSSDLAALYWSVKANKELASLAFARFEQLKPESERTHLLLGDMYRQRQRYEQAESEYKIASALAPQDPAPLFGLASAYAHDSNLDEALDTAKRALGMSPNDPDLNLLVGEILVSQRAWGPAEDYLKRSLGGAKPQILPHLHALLGQVYAQTGRIQEAISELKMGLTSDEDGSLHYQLARMYTSVGNKAAALDAFQQSKLLAQKRRERAVIAVEDSSDVMQNDIP